MLIVTHLHLSLNPPPPALKSLGILALRMFKKHFEHNLETNMAAEDPMKVHVPQIEQLFEIDPYLKSYEWEIRRR